MRRFFIFWPFWCALIVGLNIWDDAHSGRPFNFTNLALGIGIAAFGAVLYFFSRLIFKFVLSVVDDEDGRG